MNIPFDSVIEAALDDIKKKDQLHLLAKALEKKSFGFKVNVSPDASKFILIKTPAEEKIGEIPLESLFRVQMNFGDFKGDKGFQEVITAKVFADYSPEAVSLVECLDHDVNNPEVLNFYEQALEKKITDHVQVVVKEHLVSYPLTDLKALEESFKLLNKQEPTKETWLTWMSTLRELPQVSPLDAKKMKEDMIQKIQKKREESSQEMMQTLNHFL